MQKVADNMQWTDDQATLDAVSQVLNDFQLLEASMKTVRVMLTTSALTATVLKHRGKEELTAKMTAMLKYAKTKWNTYPEALPPQLRSRIEMDAKGLHSEPLVAPTKAKPSHANRPMRMELRRIRMKSKAPAAEAST